MFLSLFLIVINLLKLWFARFIPLLGDEAYYNLWSHKLALSYVDHPPMVAWFHGLANFLFGQNEFGIRIMALSMMLISTGLIYLIAKECYGKKTGLAAAFLFNLIPTFFAGSFFLTPEQPLVLFWLLTLLAMVKIIKTHNANYWYLLGVTGGLGLLSKYPMFLFFPGLILFLILSKENRYWFTKKEPYLATLLVGLVASPILIWNIQHGWLSFVHNGGRLSNPHYFNNFLTFLTLQFLMYSPPLFVFSISTFFYSCWRELKYQDKYSLLFCSLSLTIFSAFLLVSPFVIIGGHWTATAYLGMIILLAHRTLVIWPNPWGQWRFWSNLLIIILLNVLVISYYVFLYPIPSELQGKAYTINYELPAYIRQAKVNYVFANQLGVAGLVAFHGKTEIYLPKGMWKQFDIWGQPTLKPGDDILYFVWDDTNKLAQLKPLFQQVIVDENKRLFTKDSDIPIKTQVIICRGYRGGKLP